MKLRTILFVLALLAILSASAGGILHYHSAKTVAIDEVARISDSHAATVGTRISSFILENLEDVQALAGVRELPQALINPSAMNLKHANSILDHFQNAMKVSVCYLIDRQGNTIAATNRLLPHSFVGKNYGFRPYFQKALQGDPTVYMALGVTSRKRGLYAASPVYATGHTGAVGDIVIKQGLATLEDELPVIHDNTWLLVNPDGVVFSSNHTNWLYRTLWQIQPGQADNISASRQFGETPLTWSGLSIRGSEGAVDRNGNHYLRHERMIENYPGWKVVYLTNLKHISDSLGRRLYSDNTYTILAVAFLIGLAVVVLYREARADILRTRRMEKSLRLSEERFRIAFQTSPDAININRLRDGLYVQINQGFTDLTGYRPGEVLGKSSLQINIWQNPADRERLVSELKQHGRVANLEAKFRLKNGDIVTALMSATAIMLDGEAHILSITREIEAFKNIHLALQESEKRYRKVFENTGSATMIIEEDMLISMANTECECLTGYTREETEGRLYWTQFVAPADLQKTQTYHRLRCQQKSQAPKEYAFKLVDRAGNLKTTLVKIDLIPDSRQSIVSMLDISERERSAQALRESEEKYRLVVEHTNEGIIVAQDWKVQFANTRCLNFLGFSAEELKTKSFEFIHPDDMQMVMDKNFKMVEGEILPEPYQFRVFDKEGSIKWVEANGVRIIWQERPASLNFLTDITDRKRAEDALKEQENYLQTIMSTIQTGVMIIDPGNHQIVDINPCAAKMIGMPAADLVGSPSREYLQMASADLEIGVSDDLLGNGDTCVLQTVNNKHIPVRKSSARITFQGREYIVHSFLEISDMVDLLKSQEVNIDMAKKLLNLVNGEVPSYIQLADRRQLFLGAISMACHAEGGDHFFVRTIKNEGRTKTVVSLKDQSGHEVGCVLRSIITDLMHQALLTHHGDAALEENIGRLNDEICRAGLFAMDEFLTSVTVEIDHQSLMLRYVAAGHPPFILIRGNRIVSMPDPGQVGANLPMVLQPGIAYSVGGCALETGDKLVFYTDGLTEMPIKNREEIISVDELKTMVQTIIDARPEMAVSEIVNELIDRVADRSREEIVPFGTNSLGDDTTVMGLEIEDPQNCTEIILRPSSSENLCQDRDRLFEQLITDWQSHGFQGPAEGVHVVLEEAVLNAWHHGNRRTVGLPIHVRWRCANDFHLEIVDRGIGFDPTAVPDPTAVENLTKCCGRGIFLIRHYADTVGWRQGGQCLTVSFSRRPGVRSVKTCMNLWEAHEPGMGTDLTAACAP